jgi:WD40 repeat protein
MEIAQIKRVEGHSDVVWDARYSHDAFMLATASMDEAVKIWDTNATPPY